MSVQTVNNSSIYDNQRVREDIETIYDTMLGNNGMIILSNIIEKPVVNNMMGTQAYVGTIKTDESLNEYLYKNAILSEAIENVFDDNTILTSKTMIDLEAVENIIAEKVSAENIEAIKCAVKGDTQRVRAEIENAYKEELGSADRIILANAVATHLFASTMDPKVHAEKVKADGGWAEHLRKKGMLPVALEDNFGKNITPPPAPAPAPTTTAEVASTENINAVKEAVKGKTQKIRAEIDNEYKEELGSNDRILLANAVATHLFASTMDPKVHADKVKADGGWAEHLRKKGLLPVALEDSFGKNITPTPAPAPATPPAEPAKPENIEAIKNAVTGNSQKIKEEIEKEYQEELGASDRTLLTNAVAAHLLNSTMDPAVHAGKVATDGGWAEHLRKKGLLPVALEDSFGKNITPTAPAPAPAPAGETPPATDSMMGMDHAMPAEIPPETEDTLPADILSQYQMMSQLL